MSSSDAKAIAVKSLELTAALDLEGLGKVFHDQIVMRFPYSPEGMPPQCEGREQCLEMMKGILGMLKKIEWIDMEAFATENPELVFINCRSKMDTVNGKPYGNEYCFRIRVRDGKVIEHTEFFNPLPIMAAFL